MIAITDFHPISVIMNTPVPQDSSASVRHSESAEHTEVNTPTQFQLFAHQFLQRVRGMCDFHPHEIPAAQDASE
jgi:hypothetical protein